MSVDELRRVRHDLAHARADLRSAQDAFSITKLRIEVDRINEADGDAKKLGSNEEMRTRALESACEADLDYRDARRAVRDLQLRVDLLVADLDSLLDQRKQQDLDLRERNIAVMEGWHPDAVGVA